MEGEAGVVDAAAAMAEAEESLPRLSTKPQTNRVPIRPRRSCRQRMRLKLPHLQPLRLVHHQPSQASIASADTSTSAQTSAASSNPSIGRRKRSYTRNKGGPTAAPSKQSLSTQSSYSQLCAERPALVAKDPPPHLMPPPSTPTFNIKNDIDALVERVRAGAMDRPSTPGSHIDWASDEDDSLPDLPDWGLASNRSNGSRRESVISPILEDTLKPLPSLDLGTPVIVMSHDPEDVVVLPDMSVSREHDFKTSEETREAVPHVMTASSIVQEKQAEDSHVGKGGEATSESLEDLASKVEDDAKTDVSSTVATTDSPGLSTRQTTLESLSPPKAAGKLPIHPSLPPKPFTHSVSSKQPPRAEPVLSVPRPEPIVVEPPFESGLAQSIHAPGAKSAPVEASSTKSRSTERGLAASMHVPLPSAPSQSSNHLSPDASYHTHNRSRTLGRLGHRQPYTAPASGFPGHHSDPDRERPFSANISHHARTHSTPPTGPGTATAHARTVHAARPVITVDAISRLARTLNAAGIRREAPAVTVAKDSS
ncbi:hypothetical protein BKA93DRAFT_272391 [Sparassis latifolia]